MKIDSNHYGELSLEQWHARVVDGEQLPITISIESNGMRPLIRPEIDKITIMPKEHDPKVGEIVLFPSAYLHEANTYTIHRVQRIRGWQMKTMGDNCSKPDRWMATNQVWGVVTRIERGKWTIRPNDKKWICIGCCWMLLYPLRRLLSGIYRMFR